jgi:hypothetical protein
MNWKKVIAGSLLKGVGEGLGEYGGTKKKQAEAMLFPESTTEIRDYEKLKTLSPADRALFISSKSAGKAKYDPTQEEIDPVWRPNAPTPESQWQYTSRMRNYGTKFGQGTISDEEASQYETWYNSLPLDQKYEEQTRVKKIRSSGAK